MKSAMQRLYRNIIHMREEDAVVLMEGVFRTLRKESQMEKLTENEKAAIIEAFDKADKSMEELGPALLKWHEVYSAEMIDDIVEMIANGEELDSFVDENIRVLLDDMLFILPEDDVIRILQDAKVWLNTPPAFRPDWLEVLARFDEVINGVVS